MQSPHHRRGLAIAALTAASAGAVLAAWQRPSRGAEPARGTIVDRSGRVLAEDRGGERRYPQREVAAHLVLGVEKLLATGGLKPGQDVALTIDLELQKVAHRELARHEAGAAAVVEVDTGRILALVSAPSFDPAVLASPAHRAERAQLEADPRRPLIDRSLERDYPPASTFKLITAVAGLESGEASRGEEMTCTGRRTVGGRVLLDMGVHGRIDFVEALQHSCNIYFWTLGERVGMDRLAQVARDFGFGAPTGLGINGDLGGLVPDGARYRRGTARQKVLQLNAAIGAGDVQATVLQVAMAYAALANGGRLYAPQVVRRVGPAGGRKADDRRPILRRTIEASPATLALIRQGLYRAVNKRGGTAFGAKEGAVKMVGKTGTARMRDRPSEPHAWFAGWAPAERPRIAVVVLVEHGGIGGSVAAPIARDIIDAYATHVARDRKRR